MILRPSQSRQARYPASRGARDEGLPGGCGMEVIMLPPVAGRPTAFFQTGMSSEAFSLVVPGDEVP